MNYQGHLGIQYVFYHFLLLDLFHDSDANIYLYILGNLTIHLFLFNPGYPIMLIKRNYNYFHSILRLFDVLTNFLCTTSETMRHYSL